VYLKNGSFVEADSHTSEGQMITLTVGSGTLSFEADQVLNIDPIPEPTSPDQIIKPSRGESTDSEKILLDAATLQAVDPACVRSVAQIESGLHQGAVSAKGAIGRMQLMPETAATLTVNPSDAKDNAVGGAQYLRELLLRYRGNSVLALAAYNAGPGAVKQYNGVPPYAETRRYVSLVLKEYARQQAKARKEQTASSLSPSKPTAID